MALCDGLQQNGLRGKFEPHHFYIYYTPISIKLCKKKTISAKKKNRTGLHLDPHYLQTFAKWPQIARTLHQGMGRTGVRGNRVGKSIYFRGIMEQTSNMRGTEEQTQLLGTGNIENNDFDFGEQCDTRELVTRVSTAGPHFP